VQHPAPLVVFDLLQLDGQDVRGWPLYERRGLLEQLLVAAPA
jgi:ATP-dependent DNA ligase